MDFKALITKLDVLEKKQVLTEAEDRKPAKEKEREVTLPSGAKVKSRTVQGWQSQKADKDADKESKKKDEGITFQSGIANELLREFGLDEAPAADPARAQYDKFKSDDAKAAAVKQIQAMLKPNGQGVERLQNAIDPKTGIIYYGEESGEGGTVNPRQTPFSWIQKGQQKEFQDLVKAAGLTIVPVDQKTLFGTTQVAAVDPKALATLGQTPAAAAPTAAAPTAAAPTAAATPAVQKMDPNQADLDDAEMGKAMAANAATAAGPDKLKPPTPGGSANPPSKLDPAKLKRFQELLDKVKAGDKLDGGKAGGGAAAATPAAAGGAANAPTATTPAGGSTTPAAGGSTTPAAGGSTNAPAAGGSTNAPAAGGSTNAPAAAGGAAGGALLKVGSQGPEVEKVQTALKINVDGKFGPQTKTAVEKFQKANGLQVDGVVGPQTRAKLFPPAPGGSANPPAKPLPGNAVPGGGQISDNQAAESLLRDDQILAVIKSLKI